MRAWTIVGAVAVGSVLAMPAPRADASTVELLSDLRVTAASGEANEVTITYTDSSHITVEDAGSTITAGANCVAVSEHVANCVDDSPSTSFAPFFHVSLGDMDDTADLSAIDLPAVCVAGDIAGGDGDDVLASIGRAGCIGGSDTMSGGPGSDILIVPVTQYSVSGDDGDDLLIGGPWHDNLSGGADDDVIVGGAGIDDMGGGPGTDLADYSDRVAPVLIDLASASFMNGSQGEGDRLVDFEDAAGGDGDDVLLGTGGANVLDGGPGFDLLDGRDGADHIVGGDGEQDVADYSERTTALTLVLDGSGGSGGPEDGPPGARDRLDASVEAIWSGSGGDQLTGSAASNLINGGAGADTISGLGGEDVVDYSERIAGVRIALDGTASSGNADDGPVNTRDAIAPDVEHVFGGAGADTVVGNASDNVLDGGAGADSLTGLGGVDVADYSGRDDGIVAAADGTPNSGNDQDGPVGARDAIAPDIEDLVGGFGPDQLTGNEVSNRLVGLESDDLLDVRGGGSDRAECGEGDDSALVDASDQTTDCESVGAGSVSSAAFNPLSRPAADSTAPRASVALASKTSLPAVLKRGLRLIVRCSEPCRVRATLRVSRRVARRLGLRVVTIASGRAELESAGRARSSCASLASPGERCGVSTASRPRSS